MPTINRRVLLPTSLNELFFEQRIFVTVNNMFQTDSTIQLGVTIPGETEAAHNKVHDELRSYLQRTLIGIADDWVVEIGQELDSEDLVIVVSINDAHWMGYDSEDLILDTVRVFMTVKAKQMYRRLTILGARQLLVPLHFEYQNMLNSVVTLQLPQGLKLANTFGRDIDPGSESYDRACDLLQETIQVALQNKGFDWKFLNLVATRKGVKLEVNFDGANPPKAYQLNMFEAIVARALDTHCRYSDVYDELMFQSVSRHTADLDDGCEPAEQYYEY
jgi:hypothetical protein